MKTLIVALVLLATQAHAGRGGTSGGVGGGGGMDYVCQGLSEADKSACLEAFLDAHKGDLDDSYLMQIAPEDLASLD